MQVDRIAASPNDVIWVTDGLMFYTEICSC